MTLHAASPSTRPDRVVTAGTLNVLVVEDDLIIAMDIEDNVEELGHTVVGSAITAGQAVELAERMRPDVILMDLRLADGSFGGDAAREIYQRFGIRSIFVSGNLDPATRRELAALEPIAMISKPFVQHQLAAALESACEIAH